ncbi:UNVERIFIED_CONTAM: hypothetical protein B566_EDAN018860 [Ephemera danica]|nr:hypothetical protein B566_EDAN018860 [Ephemera danica]
MHWIEIGRGTSETVITAALAQCVHKLLKQGGTLLLEPIVTVEIVTEQDCLSTVTADLSRRRADIQDISERKDHKVSSYV